MPDAAVNRVEPFGKWVAFHVTCCTGPASGWDSVSFVLVRHAHGLLDLGTIREYILLQFPAITWRGEL